MSKKKKVHTAAPAPPAQPAPKGKAKKNVTRHTRFLFWFLMIALLGSFAGRWIYAITQGYFDSFVQIGPSVEQAIGNMKGRALGAEDRAKALPLQKQWDLTKAARLFDEVTVEGTDGALLNGCYCDEGSKTTVMVIPQFGEDSSADFLPGSWLVEDEGCNLLLIDPRAHGKSEGEYFGYGWLERNDVASWVNWLESVGTQNVILWGEGTGANTALFATDAGLPDCVSLIVAESPYGSLHTMAEYQIGKWYTVPAFPCLNAIEWKLSRSEAGYTAADLELAERLKAGSSTIPAIFLVAEQDGYILPEWSQTVIDSYSGDKETVTGAGAHGTVYLDSAEQVQAMVSPYLG